jgi:hypothetical protein
MSVIHQENWLHSPEKTVMYVAPEGLSSPEITNHLSKTYFEIVMGSGFIAIAGEYIDVSEGDFIVAEPKTPYIFGGNIEVLMTFEPGYAQAFETRGKERLSERSRLAIQRIEHKDMWSRFRKFLRSNG